MIEVEINLSKSTDIKLLLKLGSFLEEILKDYKLISHKDNLITIGIQEVIYSRTSIRRGFTQFNSLISSPIDEFTLEFRLSSCWKLLLSDGHTYILHLSKRTGKFERIGKLGDFIDTENNDLIYDFLCFLSTSDKITLEERGFISREYYSLLMNRLNEFPPF